MKIKSILFSLFAFIFHFQAFSQIYYPQNFAIREGFVSQMVRSNDTLFGVGQFGMSGYRIGCIIRYKGPNRDYQDGNIPFLESGQVSDVEPDGNGGWFVGINGGASVNGKTYRGVLRFNANLQQDTNFVLTYTTSSSVVVKTLKLHNGILYAGGVFVPQGSPFNRPYLVACNVSTNQLLTGFNPGFVDATQEVFDLEVHSNKLLVGGSFLASSGQPASCLASMNLQTAALIHNFDVNSEVRKIRVDVDTVIISGAFSQIGGVNRNRLAKINLTNNSLMPFNVNVDNTVYDFCIRDTSMFIGGWFSTVNSVNRSGLAKIHRYKGTVDAGFTLAPNQNRVQCMDVKDTLLIIGGNFQSVAGVSREYMAEINLKTNLVSSWDGSVNTIPDGIKFVNGDPVIFGNLNFMQLRNNAGFFALDLKTRKLLNLPLANSSFSASYTAIAKSGNRLFISGSPTTVNGTQTGRLFTVNLSNGQVTNIGTFTGGNVTVDKLMIHNGKLFVYGLFNQVNGVERQRFAAFKLSDLSLDNWNPQYEGSRVVQGMTTNGDKIFIVGMFNPPGSNLEHRGAALNANTGEWITGFRRQIVSGNNDAYEPTDIMYYNGSLYLAGDFVKQFNPQLIRNTLIKMNEQFQLDPNFNAPMDENASSSLKLGLIEDNVVAYVRTNPNLFQNRLQIFSPLGGQLLRDIPYNFSGVAPFTFGTNMVNSIIYHDSLLYAGGNWDNINGNRVLGLAIFDGKRSPFPPVSVKSTLQAEAIQLKAYPNPVGKTLNLKWEDHLGKAQIRIFDMQGRQLIRKQHFSFQNEANVEVESLLPGIYSVMLETAAGRYSLLLQKGE